jgi:chaperonin GroES
LPWSSFAARDPTAFPNPTNRSRGERSGDRARYRARVVADEHKQPITMLTDRVLVQIPQNEGERRSRAGILIPATAQVSKRLAWAEVVAVGPHVRMIKPGDQVLFNPEDRYEVEVRGDEYLILRERDIHAVASERIDGGTGLYL